MSETSETLETSETSETLEASETLDEKCIAFKGKHTIDVMNIKTQKNINYKAQRTDLSNLNDSDITHLIQVDMLNKLYMDINFPIRSLLERELNKKISGYKAQDIKKDIYEVGSLITLADTIEKLMAAKLRCFYCKREVVLLYKNVREPTQWSLDRIDNDKGHSAANTVISCLKCNLQRRVTDMGKFTFTKQLNIIKI